MDSKALKLMIPPALALLFLGGGLVAARIGMADAPALPVSELPPPPPPPARTVVERPPPSPKAPPQAPRVVQPVAAAVTPPPPVTSSLPPSEPPPPPGGPKTIEPPGEGDDGMDPRGRPINRPPRMWRAGARGVGAVEQ